MYYADEKQLLDMWHFEERFPFGGWDLMHLDGRWDSEPLPWDYREEVLKRLRPTDNLLDMDTGDGGFLLSLRHPYELTSATESDGRDYEMCVEQLAPLGIRVMYCDVDEEELPFDSRSFDVVLSRHGGYMKDELFRVLKPGGLFITEQIGQRDNRALARRLLPEFEPPFPGHCLKNAAEAFRSNGFDIIYGQEYFPKLRFMDVGALVYFAHTVQWEFPGFSVDRCARELLALNEEVQEMGCIESLQHRFILAARKIQTR
jgi:SAM-dependent methyltransferase